MLLSLSGYDCRVAYTGPTALTLAEAFRPHVLFADVILPELNGLQLAHDLRALLGGEVPLLIALTGLGRPEDHQRTQAAGYRHHLLKPADPLRLLELLANAAKAPSKTV